MAKENEDQQTSNQETLLFSNPGSDMEESHSPEHLDATEIIPAEGNDSNDYEEPETATNYQNDDVPEYAFDVGFDFEDDEEDISSTNNPERKTPKAREGTFRAVMEGNSPETSDNAEDNSEITEKDTATSKTSGGTSNDEPLITLPPEKPALDPTLIIDSEEFEKFSINTDANDKEDNEEDVSQNSQNLEGSGFDTVLDDEDYFSGDYKEPEENREPDQNLPTLDIDKNIGEDESDYQSPPENDESSFDIMGFTAEDNIPDDDSFGVEELYPDMDYPSSGLPDAPFSGDELAADDTDLTDIMKKTFPADSGSSEAAPSQGGIAETEKLFESDIPGFDLESDHGDDFGTLNLDLDNDESISALPELQGDDFHNQSLNAESMESDFENVKLNLKEQQESDFTNVELNAKSPQKAEFENKSLGTPLENDDESISAELPELEIPDTDLLEDNTHNPLEDGDEEMLEPYSLPDDVLAEENEGWSDDGKEPSNTPADAAIPADSLEDDSLGMDEDEGLSDIFNQANSQDDINAQNLLSGEDVDSQEFGLEENPADPALINEAPISTEGFDLIEGAEEDDDDTAENALNDSEDSEMALPAGLEIEDSNDAFTAQSGDKPADMLDNSVEELETSANDLSEEFIAEDLLKAEEEENPDEDSAAFPSAEDSVDLPAVELDDDTNSTEDNEEENTETENEADEEMQASELEGENTDSAEGQDDEDIGGGEEGEESLDNLFEKQAEAAENLQDWSDAIEPVPIAAEEDDEDDPSKVLYMNESPEGISLTEPITEEEQTSKFKETKIYKALVNCKKIGMLIGNRIDKIIYWRQNWRTYLIIASAIITTICSAIWIGSYMD